MYAIVYYTQPETITGRYSVFAMLTFTHKYAVSNKQKLHIVDNVVLLMEDCMDLHQ